MIVKRMPWLLSKCIVCDGPFFFLLKTRNKCWFSAKKIKNPSIMDPGPVEAANRYEKAGWLLTPNVMSCDLGGIQPLELQKWVANSPGGRGGAVVSLNDH